MDRAASPPATPGTLAPSQSKSPQMSVKRDPSKFLQIGFLTLLFVCVLQVGWWITENVNYTREVMLALDTARQPEAAPRPGAATLPPALAELERASAGRTNRYFWEGGFFLVVLIGGMAVLTRTIRHDAELRRRQQNFLAAVSHEFKSPLASMQLAAETLVLRAREPDSRRLGQRILEDCERLLRMVDNLLDTTRLEEGRHHLKPERTVLADVVAACIAAVAERAERHGLAVDVDVAPTLALAVDRTALETILRNLIDNAIKACVAGEGRTIGVQAWHEDGKVALAVCDDGLGFPPDDAALMFEKFHRLGDELRRATPGTGLGLYIVKRLADLSGASIRAESEGPGRGACFTLVWPGRALA